MPKEVFGRDFQFLPRSELLTFEEIVRLARVFAREGVSKLRITGGEPLLRRELERLVDMLAGIPGIEDIALTTNGALLPARARALADAGLRRVTVSLDALVSLRPRIVRQGELERFGPTDASLFNVNDAADLAAAERMLGIR